MTAEIAILNRSAVALAADSAVTIGRPPDSKIYNTVNKIFELSAHEPVALMVYGRLDFMGMPFETIAKEYRQQLGTTTFPHLSGYREHFLAHLAKSIPFSDQDHLDNVALIISDIFTKAHNEVDKLVYEDIIRRRRFYKSKVNGFSRKYLNAEIAKLRAKRFAPGFNRIAVPASLTALVDALIDRAFNQFPTAQTKVLLRKYAGYFLAKDTLSSYRSGIVIAGFGTDEWFPSLEVIEIDGMIDGRLKSVESKRVDIDRRGPQADIIGFAQDDMVKSFLDGVDPRIRSYFDSLIGLSIRDTFKAVAKAFLSDDNKVEQFMQGAEGFLQNMTEDFKQKGASYIEDNATNPIKDMIRGNAEARACYAGFVAYRNNNTETESDSGARNSGW